MRKTVAIVTQGLYLLLTEMIAVYLITFPVHAFQLSSSSTGYVRVASSTALVAYQAANRVAFTTAVASAISAPTAASVALRIATGPVGWAALGVSAAIVLANMYYSSAEVATLKTAALNVQPSVVTVPDWTSPAGTILVNNCVPLVVGCIQTVKVPNARTISVCSAVGQTPLIAGPPGWAGSTEYPSGGPCYDVFQKSYNGANGAQLASSAPPTSITQSQAETYVNGLPAGSPSSIESNTEPVGQGAVAPAADNVTTLQVSPTEVVPIVKPASQVQPTDAVIDPNAPPPTGPQPVTTPSTTTTTTTNPDGSTTTTQTQDPGVMSCSIANHDQRTFGSVLQEHITRWQGSGLSGALNLIKNLTWPETIPTYSLQSNLFGHFTLDFSGWSGILVALRGLVIAIASFVAYRIIFVGSK